MPPAWENDAELGPAVSAFYEYESTQGEPWDGPAAMAFSDIRDLLTWKTQAPIALDRVESGGKDSPSVLQRRHVGGGALAGGA